MGAGLFALPAAFSYVGIGWGSLLFWILALGMLATHLAFARELLMSDGKHRLSHFVERRFGKKAKWLPMVTYPLHLLSSSYAYLLLGGGFVVSVLQIFGLSVSEINGILAFWLIFGLVSLGGLIWIARAETYVTAALIVSLLMLSGLQLNAISFDVLSATRTGWMVAFGIFLFAVSGFSGVGTVLDIAGRNKKMSYSAVTIGTLTAALLSWVFGIVFFLASRGTIGDRVIEFNSYVPTAFFWLLPVLGLSAIATSYVTVAADLKAVLQNDFHWSNRGAQVLTYCLPLILLVFVTRDFVNVVSFIGAVFVGLNAAMICALGAVRPMPNTKRSSLMKGAYGLLAVTYLGFAIYTVYLAF